MQGFDPLTAPHLEYYSHLCVSFIFFKGVDYKINLINLGSQTLETDRLIIKKTEENDLEKIYSLFNYKTICDKVGWKYWKTFKEFKESIALISKPDDYEWVIFLKDGELPIGIIGVHTKRNEDFACEIGYSIHPKYQNFGYCTEALKEVSRFLITKVGYYRVVCRYRDNNISSKRVLEKSNFIYEGTERCSRYRNDHFYDTLLLKLI